MPKISFIIVNYSTKSLIKPCIDNLLNINISNEIIFVDNNSPDGSAEYFKQLYKGVKNVTLIETKNNGISAGYNLALKKAKGDYHIYLGTDAFPTSKSINEIYTYLENNKDVGVVSANLYTRDGKSDLDAHRGFPTPWVSFTHFSGLEKLFGNTKLFGGYFLSYKDINTTHEIDAGISHFLAVNPIIYNKVGEWDEKFFMFGEDIDFCYRVKQAGFKIMFLGKTKVLHYKGASVGRETSKDIENAMNSSFDNNLQKNINQKQSKKKVNKAGKIRVAQASTFAMRHFYTKHYKKKYNFLINFLVISGTYLLEKVRVANILFK